MKTVVDPLHQTAVQNATQHGVMLPIVVGEMPGSDRVKCAVAKLAHELVLGSQNGERIDAFLEVRRHYGANADRMGKFLDHLTEETQPKVAAPAEQALQIRG